MNKKAFSLIELLITIVIVAIVFLIGFKIYSNYKKNSFVTWAKAEMMDLSRLMEMAKNSDGGYHQFIYAMGYRPEGKIYAAVGTAASDSTICCDKYPDPGTSPCVKNWRGGFSYYNCEDDDINKATDNIEICAELNQDSCAEMNQPEALETADFSTCTPTPADWCDCNLFTVGAAVYSSGDITTELSINEKGKLCKGDL